MTEKDIDRLMQCITCQRDPQTCGCEDEDSDGMCVCWAERKEE